MVGPQSLVPIVREFSAAFLQLSVNALHVIRRGRCERLRNDDVGFSQHLEDPRGQVLALFVIAVAAAEAGVGLGLVIALNRNTPGAGVADLTQLKG